MLYVYTHTHIKHACNLTYITDIVFSPSGIFSYID